LIEGYYNEGKLGGLGFVESAVEEGDGGEKCGYIFS
jgi:hypothetical protein